MPSVRVVDDEGTQVGVMSSQEALVLARERGLDLVEVSPQASPPVCRIMDYGKFKYEASKRATKDKKKQHRVQNKEIKFRVKIDEHDFEFKVNNARKFLDALNRVRERSPEAALRLVARRAQVTAFELSGFDWARVVFMVTDTVFLAL